MTNDEILAGMRKAYELLTYGEPDPDLTNDVSADAWRRERDEWIEKYPPSKLPVEPDERQCEHLRSELLAEKRKDGNSVFDMRQCLDCMKIFRVRSSLNR